MWLKIEPLLQIGLSQLNIFDEKAAAQVLWT